MQGENLSSILCTTTVDKVAKDCPISDYVYENSVNIPKMGFCDDLLDIRVCGVQTKEMNDYTREEINKRRLQFSADKCVRMHIRNRKMERKKDENEREDTKCEKVTIDQWELETVKRGTKLKQEDTHKGECEIKTVNHHTYLGTIIENDGSNSMNLKSKLAKGQAAIRDIFQILNSTYFGSFYFEAVKFLRESLLMSVMTHI